MNFYALCEFAETAIKNQRIDLLEEVLATIVDMDCSIASRNDHIVADLYEEVEEHVLDHYNLPSDDEFNGPADFPIYWGCGMKIGNHLITWNFPVFTIPGVVQRDYLIQTHT